MRKILFLVLMMLPLRLFSTGVEIIADINGESISNLDIERRVNLVSALFGTKNVDEKEVRSQTLRQLIDEIIIASEAQRLNVTLSSEELESATVLFLTQNFKLKEDEVDKYVKKHNIDLGLLKKQIKCQLLWGKIIEARIIPFISVSDREADDVKGRSDYLVTFQEFTIPYHENGNVYNVAEDLVKKLRSADLAVNARKTTVSLSKSKGELRNILEKLGASEVTSFNKGNSVVKVLSKVRLDYELLESTLKIKQIVIKNSEDLLNNIKEQKVNCSNFDKLVDNFKLPNAKEFEVKMRDLNPELQILLGKASVDEVVEFRENSTARLMMLCDIKSNKTNIEAIKQQIYQQKIMVQSNILLDSMRRNAAISYRYS